LCQQAPFNNLLKLVAVSESSDVNKNDTNFSPTTLLLILKVKFDQVASTHPPIMKVNRHMIGSRTQKHKENKLNALKK